MDFGTALEELKKENKIKRGSWRENIFLAFSKDKTVNSYIEALNSYSWDNDIILSEQWMIDSGKGYGTDLYPFTDAIKALAEGHSVKLSHWNDQHLYLDRQSQDVILKHFVECRYSPTFEDFISEDWIVL